MATRTPPARRFPSVSDCDPAGREAQSVAADLDGTLLISPSAYPYYFLLAVEAGGFLRGAAFLLSTPVIFLLYAAVSESLAIRFMVFAALAGVKLRDIQQAARAVLPRFYADNVRRESWEVFHRCGGRRVIVTASPTVMVEPFAKELLGADKVIGTEIDVDAGTGKATGFLKKPGVLMGIHKKRAVENEFGENRPDLGLGDRESDHDFMALCKEAYMVDPDAKAAPLPREHLNRPIVFHDGRLVQRPTPLTALLTYLWLPVGFVLAVLRIYLTIPLHGAASRFLCPLLGIRLVISGRPPPPPAPGASSTLFVCNHRTMLDPIIVSLALNRRVSCVTYAHNKFSKVHSPLRTVALARDRAVDADRIAALLRDGDVVMFPEGTTCREPFVLRFSALFAELAERIVPVAIDAPISMFYGNTINGYKWMEPYFFFMNPRPGFHVTFLDMVPPEMTCMAGKSRIDVANYVQRTIGGTLGFECSTLRRKDKYLMLSDHDGNYESHKKDK